MKSARKRIEYVVIDDVDTMDDPKGGCALATVLLAIIAVLLLLTALASCTKDECIKPITPPSKDKICMGCNLPNSKLDTTLRR